MVIVGFIVIVPVVFCATCVFLFNNLRRSAIRCGTGTRYTYTWNAVEHGPFPFHGASHSGKKVKVETKMTRTDIMGQLIEGSRHGDGA